MEEQLSKVPEFLASLPRPADFTQHLIESSNRSRRQVTPATAQSRARSLQRLLNTTNGTIGTTSLVFVPERTLEFGHINAGQILFNYKDQGEWELESKSNRLRGLGYINYALRVDERLVALETVHEVLEFTGVPIGVCTGIDRLDNPLKTGHKMLEYVRARYAVHGRVRCVNHWLPIQTHMHKSPLQDRTPGCQTFWILLIRVTQSSTEATEKEQTENGDGKEKEEEQESLPESEERSSGGGRKSQSQRDSNDDEVEERLDEEKKYRTPTPPPSPTRSATTDQKYTRTIESTQISLAAAQAAAPFPSMSPGATNQKEDVLMNARSISGRVRVRSNPPDGQPLQKKRKPEKPEQPDHPMPQTQQSGPKNSMKDPPEGERPRKQQKLDRPSNTDQDPPVSKKIRFWQFVPYITTAQTSPPETIDDDQEVMLSIRMGTGSRVFNTSHRAEMLVKTHTFPKTIKMNNEIEQLPMIELFLHV